ncbi:hypothetical protein DSECCO2_396820 [anaerobic digester metagenome]
MLRGELFSTDMVRAYLDGRKMHTARPIKPTVPDNVVQIFDVDPLGYVAIQTTDLYLGGFQNRKAKHAPGDYIYCRETWNGMCRDCKDCTREGYLYRADGTFGLCCPYELKWAPSIHMPSEAARLFFRVSRVEVMRLEDVTEEFAMEDGFLPSDGGLWSATDNFKYFWLNTYGSDARWMWVYWTDPVSKEEAYANAQ